MSLNLVDSHCHLNLLDLTPYENGVSDVIADANQQGVSHFLNVSVDLKTFPDVLATAKQHNNVYASMGIHPNDKAETPDVDTLVKLADDPKVVAIGETGLDYFRSEGDLEWQRDRFRTHIAVAKATQKPLIIHTREAREDTLKIMTQEAAREAGGVMHCFTETWEMAKAALEMGFMISFSGIVTFKNARALQDVACRVPLDRMLIETDSPYLAPTPYRGTPNVPAYVCYVAEFIANLRDIPIETVAEQTSQNFFTLIKKDQ